jgi:CDP-diacylglycerol--glycerol-3-phosphate 3-phosphatidyltransferase
MTSATEHSQNSPWNLPNAITVVRILLVPLFIWSELNFGLGRLSAWWGVAIFVVAISTDGIDGAIARRRGLITNLGKLLDPIADKALTGAGFILLAYFGFVPFWAIVLILIREVGLTAYRLIVANKVVIAANAGGKIKTIMQAIVIPLMLSPVMQWSAWIQIFAQLLFWITALITLITGVQYVTAAAKAKNA